ncbi:MAG: RIP metalloprotease RseP [Sphingomonadales bacterium]|nr:MAG: RIP metalloprotease RseP [Sphingomonadales bacterium]
MSTLAAPGFLSSALWFLVVLGPLVFVHELGHYLAARLFRIRIDGFSIGFGPEIFGWTDKHRTRWRISVLPLGGYVKFAGDMNAASQPDPEAARLSPAERERLFQFKPIWQRAVVVAAGPMINFAFAILIFAALFTTVGQPYTVPKVAGIVPNSAAQAAGIKPGDMIVRLEGQSVRRFEDIINVIAINPGHPLNMTIARDGRQIDLSITPRRVEERDRFGNVYERGLIGLQATGRDVIRLNPFQAVGAATAQTLALTKSMATTLWQIVSGRRAVTELGGPLKIADYSGQSAALGLVPLVTFIALISINLGFVNLLPVPMLDGGHLVLYAIEGVRGRPVSPKVLEWSFRTGLALVLSLMLFLTVNDLASFGVWNTLARIFS